MVLDGFIYTKHLCFHDGANRTTGSKKEISNVDLPPQGLFGDNDAVLINKRKIAYGVINRICGGHVFFSEYRQLLFFLVSTRGKHTRYDTKHETAYRSVPVFRKYVHWHL